MSDIPQPGSLDAEAGIFASSFDQTGSRLIVGCADKSMYVFRSFTCCSFYLLIYSGYSKIYRET